MRYNGTLSLALMAVVAVAAVVFVVGLVDDDDAGGSGERPTHRSAADAKIPDARA